MHILTQKGWMYMDHVDNATVQRVWQRVKSPQMPLQAPHARPNELADRILEEWQTGQRYLALQAMPEFKANPELKRLWEQKQSQLACLKGIYRLSVNASCKIPAVMPKTEPGPVLLRKCYGSLLRCCGFYSAATADREFGDAYRQLAEQNRQQAYGILMLLGGLK